MKKIRPLGLILGALVLLVFTFMPTPEGLTEEAKYAAGITLLMTIWWITEAISIYATAFVPLALFPFYGILSASETAANYGENFVFMLLAGLIIAKAIEKQELHKRIALNIINLLGTNKRYIILSFMLATSLLSMWIANMAVALLMLPIATSIIDKESSGNESDRKRFSIALLLSIAYASSIGGASNLVGTPPNMIFAGAFEKYFPEGPEITFLYWLKIGVILWIVFIPITWLYLCFFMKIKGHLSEGKDVVKEELKKLGPIRKGEARILILFIATGLGWIFRKDIQIDNFTIYGWSHLFAHSKMIHDSTLAMLSVVLLFCIPGNKPGERLLDWDSAKTIPWGTVMIVGGGYAIAAAFKKTDLSTWLGTSLSFVGDFPYFLMILSIATVMIFLTEINSNTATANIFMPILATLSVTAGINPLAIMIPATFAISYAFMLPSGSGTNAVVFASERVTIPEMAKTGFFLNLITLILLTIILSFIILPLLGVDLKLPVWAK